MLKEKKNIRAKERPIDYEQNNNRHNEDFLRENKIHENNRPNH